jgi:hypothetical protein
MGVYRSIERFARCESASSARFPHEKAPRLGPRRAAVGDCRLRRSRWSKPLLEVSRASRVSLSQFASGRCARRGSSHGDRAERLLNPNIWFSSRDSYQRRLENPYQRAWLILAVPAASYHSDPRCSRQPPTICRRVGRPQSRVSSAGAASTSTSTSTSWSEPPPPPPPPRRPLGDGAQVGMVGLIWSPVGSKASMLSVSVTASSSAAPSPPAPHRLLPGVHRRPSRGQRVLENVDVLVASATVAGRRWASWAERHLVT